ncbi:MAG: hypothetical protein JNK59_01640 [Sterolibacteriaceae bacterium]|nr:hypothetical protein [Sterolibacteriaceae bacterium]
MNPCRTAAIVAASVLFSGCATITSNEMQLVSLSTKGADGNPVEKAKCSLTNDKGRWEMVAPGFVSVRRSAEDLTVECKKEGLADGFLRAISRAAGGMFGNIIFGGGIGALIDHNKGTGYDYPNDLPVRMGASSVVDKKDEGTSASAMAETSAVPKSN